MQKKDQRIVKHIVKKVMKDFEKDRRDNVDVQEEMEFAVKDEILLSMEPPSVEWISLAELDRAEQHKNKNGDFLSN